MVIGGVVVGCSVLFHLALHGWTDIVLVERDELTSGSTWHAPGGMHTIVEATQNARGRRDSAPLCPAGQSGRTEGGAVERQPRQTKRPSGYAWPSYRTGAVSAK
ncbi:hypothetical protein MesoLjLa_27940 [Mesorhizobium sp. L-2-11]|nr:hypothetical protein MesoLjLa_27940 [Mesorhizobium sp. L-2-11]